MGATNYQWDFGSTTPSVLINPLSTTSYSVIGTNSISGCSNTASITVLVLKSPTVVISGKKEICKGESVSLTAGGANTYLWSTSATSSVISIKPVTSVVYSVTGTNTLNSCSGNAQFKVDVFDCNSISENNLLENLSLFPNPSTGLFYVNAQSAQAFEINDATGKLIYSGKIEAGENKIDLSNYPNGIYFLHFEQSGLSKKIKLVKID